MLFDRRDKPSLLGKIWSWIWPRKGFRRAGIYLWHRITRLKDTEHGIAAGFAAGAAVSFTPFLGFHFLMAFALAWVLRGNLIASAIGTIVGNPWTFPFIFALTSNVGAMILGDDVTSHVPGWSWEALLDAPFEYLAALTPLVFPFLIGSIPIAIIVWIGLYFSLRTAITTNRNRRLAKRKAKEQKAIDDGT